LSCSFRPETSLVQVVLRRNLGEDLPAEPCRLAFRRELLRAEKIYGAFTPVESAHPKDDGILSSEVEVEHLAGGASSFSISQFFLTHAQAVSLTALHKDDGVKVEVSTNWRVQDGKETGCNSVKFSVAKVSN
jgi:hypothetical protein